MSTVKNPAAPVVPGTPFGSSVSERLSLALVVLGIGFRLYHWWYGRSLWQDEASLAVNIQSRGLLGLLEPLDLHQGAPYLFLASTDLLTTAFGYDERVLRFVPLLASVLMLILFWRMARRVLAPWAVPVAVATFSFSYRFIYYGQEFKQYSLEVFVVVLMLWLLARNEAEPERGGQGLGWLGLAGVLGVFAAHTAPFVLAGVGLALVYAKRCGRGTSTWPALFLVGGAWIVAFAINYLVFIRPVAEDPFMKLYWEFAHAPGPWSREAFGAGFTLASHYFSYLGYAGVYKMVFALLGVMGVAVAFRRRSGVMLAAVFGLACFGFAFLAGQAPLYGRLNLFLFPLALMLVVGGLQLLSSGRWRVLGAGLAVLLLIPVGRQIRSAVAPIVVEDQREAIQYLAEHRAREEPVYVIFYAQPALRYYRSLHEPMPGNYTFGSTRRLWDEPTRQGRSPRRSKPDLDLCLNEIAALAEHPRFWVLTAHMDKIQEDFLERVDSLGYSRVDEFKVKGAGAFLFQRKP